MDLPSPGIESVSLASPELAGRFFTIAPPGKPYLMLYVFTYLFNALALAVSAGSHQWTKIPALEKISLW